MADFSSVYPQNLYLSPEQQNLLMAALNANNSQQKQNEKKGSAGGLSHNQSTSSNTSPSQENTSFDPSRSSYFESPLLNDAPGSGHLGFAPDESPFLDFDPDLDFDIQGADDLIGELPDLDNHELGDKRKSIGESDSGFENGKKRRESEDKDKASKKPGRKPLTSEPTTKRKAQNRAAQRAFRERKEKHLKDLETKVDELEKASETANQENGLLRAQVGRLQVELREYRKRLSWLSGGNGLSTMSAFQNNNTRNITNLSNNDFFFDFPKFGDLPGNHMFKNSGSDNQNKTTSPTSSGVSPSSDIPGIMNRGSLKNASQSTSKSTNANGTLNGYPSGLNTSTTYKQLTSTSSSASNSDSPSASSESQHGPTSSMGTSPEPSLNSPNVSKTNEAGCENCSANYSTIDGEKSFCDQLGMACGNIRNPVPAARSKNNNNSNLLGQLQPTAADQSLSFDWLAQQNGGSFDPVLFNDYREPQDAILSQDFGAFFNDAFPLPDLDSPFGNLNETASPKASNMPKPDLISQIDKKQDEDDEVVPGEDKSQMMTCTKIWDRLQSMEKFRNGEIDVDSLCTELRTKARCSEGGVVVNKRDVDDIMGRVDTPNTTPTQS
ncbi:transcription factor PAP1-domain-containing protein [Talaromyces proteolyticus]|uniref:Transcription factor PAP1-domain-containing protein n=1 Tax=Talaromyces proteolyticus TaxID=1131652 RepID=A0AAD4KYQ9_9EURO|nr:transcription factor PAP1-domain-containing protein [Talaromyces proteolyticus]KAH8703094.1 transcription factor PAP1-domain-containing protein [Talaromyces proteolyticus]